MSGVVPNQVGSADHQRGVHIPDPALISPRIARSDAVRHEWKPYVWRAGSFQKRVVVKGRSVHIDRLA